MSDDRGQSQTVSDRPADAEVSTPAEIAQGFMRYQRFAVTLKDADGSAQHQQRDLLRGGRVVAVLTVDPRHDCVVLIRQFRLSGQLATGRGDMVEIVAGRVDAGESARDAAIRDMARRLGRGLARLLSRHRSRRRPFGRAHAA